MFWLFSSVFLGGVFLVVLRPVSTSPPPGEARCPFRARELGFVRSAFWYAFFLRPLGVLLARSLTLPPFTPALSQFCSCFYFSA